MSAVVLELRGIGKRYGRRIVLHELDLSVAFAALRLGLRHPGDIRVRSAAMRFPR